MTTDGVLVDQARVEYAVTATAEPWLGAAPEPVDVHLDPDTADTVIVDTECDELVRIPLWQIRAHDLDRLLQHLATRLVDGAGLGSWP